MLEISGIELTLQEIESEGLLKEKIAAGLKIAPDAVTSLRIIRKSLDARRSRPPRWIYTVEISFADEEGVKFPEQGNWKIRAIGGPDALRPPRSFNPPP